MSDDPQNSSCESRHGQLPPKPRQKDFVREVVDVVSEVVSDGFNTEPQTQIADPEEKRFDSNEPVEETEEEMKAPDFARLSPQTGPRIGCGWSFETLDSNHPDPAKRSFVRCVKCNRAYLQLNASREGFFCTSIHCKSQQFAAFETLPPLPLSEKPMKAIPFNSGPLNSPSDRPLGISAGTLFLDHSNDEKLTFSNNSGQPVELPWHFGPIWCAVNWDISGSPPSSRRVVVQPGQNANAVIHAHSFRPIRAEENVEVGTNQGVYVFTSQLPTAFHLCWLLVALAAFVHWVGMAALDVNWVAAAICAVSLGAILALICMFTPALIYRPILRFSGIPRGSLWRTVHDAVSGVTGTNVALRAASRASVVSVLFACFSLSVWPIWYGVLLMSVEGPLVVTNQANTNDEGADETSADFEETTVQQAVSDPPTRNLFILAWLCYGLALAGGIIWWVWQYNFNLITAIGGLIDRALQKKKRLKRSTPHQPESLES